MTVYLINVMLIFNLQFSKRLTIRPQAHLTKEYYQQLQIDFNFKRYVSSWSSIFNFGQNGYKDMWNLHFSLCKASVITDNNFFLPQQPPISAAKQNRKGSTYDRLRKRTVDNLDELFW